MAAIEGALPFSVASVVEDVLQQHGSRSRGLDLDARRAEEDGKFWGNFARIFVVLMLQVLVWLGRVHVTFLCKTHFEL